MSSTRRAAAGAAFRQERFASSLGHGLLANLVALRCESLEPHDKPAIWFLQWESWQLGGLLRLAEDMIRAMPEADWRAGATAPQLEMALGDVCLNPENRAYELVEAVEEYMRLNGPGRGAAPVTTVSERLWQALDYCRTSGQLTVIDGKSRIGKSFAAAAWCSASRGMGRLVQVPCSNDDIGFFRAIGRALGLSTSLQLKAAEMRTRIEDVLTGGHGLTIVFDEAHYLWPQNWQRYAMPSRVNWIMTALVNNKVPVALVTTPQFFSLQKNVEKLTGWNSEQFVGRIGYLEQLGRGLTEDDCYQVAKWRLPDAEDASLWRGLAKYAMRSNAGLGCLDSVVSRSKWLADQAGSLHVTADHIKAAARERIMAFDSLSPISGASGADGARRDREADFGGRINLGSARQLS